MASTDYTPDGSVFPQDGASSGIADADADWNNAAYLGLLAQAEASNYVSKGFSINPDYVNNEVTIGEGVAYIEDSENIDYRKHFDSEIAKSGTLDKGYLAFIFQSASQTVSFENNTGVNYIYIGFTRQSQDSNFIRVSDTEQSGDRLLKIAEVDAGAQSVSFKNRNAGYEWEFVTKHSTNGLVNQADVPIPDNSYDEYKVKFIGVTGDVNSTNTNLQGTVNNHSANYWYRTTQSNTQQSSHYDILQCRPSDTIIEGHILYTVGEQWTYDNRTTSNEEKNYSFSGHNKSPADTTPLNSLQYEFNSGQIKGTWNIWGRNRV